MKKEEAGDREQITDHVRRHSYLPYLLFAVGVSLSLYQTCTLASVHRKLGTSQWFDLKCWVLQLGIHARSRLWQEWDVAETGDVSPLSPHGGGMPRCTHKLEAVGLWDMFGGILISAEHWSGAWPQPHNQPPAASLLAGWLVPVDTLLPASTSHSLTDSEDNL